MRYRIWSDLNLTDPIGQGLDLREWGRVVEEWEIRLVQKTRNRFEVWEDKREGYKAGYRFHVIDTTRTDEQDRALIVRSYEAKLGRAAADDIVDRLNVAHMLSVLREDRLRRGIVAVPIKPVPSMLKGLRLVSPAMASSIYEAMVSFVMKGTRKALPGSILAALEVAESNPDRTANRAEAEAKATAAPDLSAQVAPLPAQDMPEQLTERLRRVARGFLLALMLGSYAVAEMSTASYGVGLITSVEAGDGHHIPLFAPNVFRPVPQLPMLAPKRKKPPATAQGRAGGEV